MVYKLSNQTIALAAIAQSAALVHNIATKGVANKDDSAVLVGSLFTFNSDTTAGIYGGADKLNYGLTVLNDVLGSSPNKDQQALLRYMMNILNLQARLNKHPGILDVLSSRLQHAQRGIALHPDDSYALNGQLAKIYQDTIGTLGFRIKVSGDQEILQQSQHSDHVRALLLCGIRGATLWDQVGGRRWKLIFQRGKIRQTINSLLNN